MCFEVHPFDRLDLREVAELVAEEQVRAIIGSLDCFEPAGGGFVGLLDGETVGCAGVVPVYGPNSIKGVAWAFLLSGSRPVFLQIHRAVKRYLDETPYRRIEAHTDSRFSVARRWVELLGFRLEAEKLVNWFPDGRDADQWALIK